MSALLRSGGEAVERTGARALGAFGTGADVRVVDGDGPRLRSGGEAGGHQSGYVSAAYVADGPEAPRVIAGGEAGLVAGGGREAGLGEHSADLSDRDIRVAVD